MDRRYGGDRSAPPRPPKSIPRLHRQRAPDPPIMSSNPFHTNLENDDTRPPLQPRNQQLNQQPPPLPPTPTPTPTPTLTPTPALSQVLPIIVPLTTLQASASFSRRRPPPPGTALPVTIPAATTPLTAASNANSQHFDIQAPSPVTLAAPRPETERLANEYVDTPFRTPQLATRLQHGSSTTTAALSQLQQPFSSLSHGGDHQQISTSINVSNARSISNDTGCTHHKSTIPFVGQSISTAVSASMAHGTTRTSNRSSVLPATAITKQPLPYTKDILSSTQLHDDIDIHPSSGSGGEPLNITCPQCKRCRCEQCQRPRQLPSRWVCDNTCLCSAETIIDYTSCLCCVKALFYHCSKDHEIECEGDSISCADDPCSCLPHKRTQRWAWLSALSLALPCLWFYWPMRGCVAICAKCYARHSRHGCRCPVQISKQSAGINISNGNNVTINSGRTIIRTSDLTPEKRLLDSSPEF